MPPPPGPGPRLEPCLYPGCCRHGADAAADVGRHQRAPGVPLLPAHLQLLLLAQAALPGQARAVRHAVRVRVLPQALPHQELAHDAQEPAAQGLQRHAQTSAQNHGHQERARHAAAAAPPVSHPETTTAGLTRTTSTNHPEVCIFTAVVDRANTLVFIRLYKNIHIYIHTTSPHPPTHSSPPRHISAISAASQPILEHPTCVRQFHIHGSVCTSVCVS
jgi:hypothetical protein